MKRKSVEDTDSVTLTTTIFGASDGIVASIALILATMTHGRRVVVAAVIGLFIAEGLGMAASQFLSDPKRNLRQAMIMGAATSITIIVPAVPWIFLTGNSAAVISCVIALTFAGLISRARPGGWSTWLQTYGVLIGVGAIAAIAGRLS
jgi:L-cystine uptake protein TcyP (sodium:dicarboxylate symporter family)